MQASFETTGADDAAQRPTVPVATRSVWPLALVAVAVAVVAGAIISRFGFSIVPIAHSRVEPKEKSTIDAGAFIPTTSQWAALSVEPVTPGVFRTVVTTDGRIAIDEDNTTPVFSPYQGRVLALHAKAGDRIEAGQPLFTIAATDMVQAQNDLVAAVAALNKTNSAVNLAEINLTRARNLFEMKAGSQREFQAAEDTRNATRSDKSAAEAALEAARNRLRLLGKTDAEIATFQAVGRIGPETVIKAPLSGTVVQRKVGPGQFVGGASSDPVFVIGDLSKVWVVANVKETDVPAITVGQPIELRLLALPGRTFSSHISYVASAVDPSSRRLTVRAELPNTDGIFKAEMFAMVDIVTSDSRDAPSVPRSALIYDGESAHVWSVGTDRSIVRRRITVGAASSGRVQIIDGIANGDRIVAKGSLFIDRLAGGAE